MLRINLRLDDETYRRLRTEATCRSVSLACVVREAIDRLLVDSERRAAGDRLLAAPPMPVEDWPEMKKELLARNPDC